MPGPGQRHHMQPARPKNMRKTFLRVVGYMTRYRIRLALIIAFVIVSSLSGVAGTYFLKPIINEGILPLIGKDPSGADFLPLIRLISVMAAVFAAGALASFVYSRLMVTLSNRTLNSIRKELFEHMEDLPIHYFDTHTHGELMSRYTNDVDTLREAISNGASGLINSFISVVGTFIMMLVLSPLLTILIVMMLVVMLFVVKTIGGKSAMYFKAQQKEVGTANGYIEEMIEGQKEVKVFCREDEVKAEFAQLNENLRRASTNAHSYASVMMPIMGNLSYVNYALTAAAGAVLVIRGWMDIGSVASFLQYTRQFSQPIVQISQQFNAILAALAGAERIFEVIDEQPEEDKGYVRLVNGTEDALGTITESEERTGLWAWKHPHGDGRVTYTRLCGDVRFENVTFGYVPEKTVLNNVTLFANPGQKIALVGSTGAGKTTITNLINRFYELTDGKIRYDGINITKMKKDDLRRSLAMVLQDTHLFTGTVRENIRYGRLDASDAEVVAAAKLANAHWFIEHLPNGYDTLLSGDGTNLSQGQRQLLAIARAAVADPPVLILDEATSSIDTRTEALIEKGMDTLMHGRTVFVIAHRLSTVRNADCILVLENGEIIERGNHDELLAQ
ncbi:MAG: ABC transporter ATP-binding protein, partial [Acetanaerobacterium sp.]